MNSRFSHLIRATALASVLIASWACDREQSERDIGEPVQTAPPAEARQDTSRIIDHGPSRLIKGVVEVPGDPNVLVEIDYDALEALRHHPDDSLVAELRDPLRAARLFAATVEVSPSAKFILLEQSSGVEEGAGMFIASVRVIDGPHAILMRLVSEPDEEERPTLWVLNDFERR